MADMKWIKLKVDMFDDEKIKIIQSMPEGDTILVIWIRMIALAGKCNADGLMVIEDEFPYTDEMLSVIFSRPLATIRLALETFIKFHMIENTQKGIYITNFDKHQNLQGMEKVREQNRLRKQRQREKALLLTDSCRHAVPEAIPGQPCPVTEEVTAQPCPVTEEVMVKSRDLSRDFTQQNKKEEKEKEYINISSGEDILSVSGKKETDSASAPIGAQGEGIDYQEVMDCYNKACPGLPHIKAMTDSRKRKVRALLKELDKCKILLGDSAYGRLWAIFRMAQESDFLSGRDGGWKGCSFDWLISKGNALKVLEGNYANRDSPGGGMPFGRPAMPMAGFGERALEGGGEIVGDDWMDYGPGWRDRREDV